MGRCQRETLHDRYGSASADSRPRRESRAKACAPPARRLALPPLTAPPRIAVLLLLGGVIVSLIDGSLPAFARSASASSRPKVWNPVTEKFGALAPIYGTLVTSVIAMLDRRAGRPRHRDLPDRALPAVAAPADRHRHRAAGRHSQHHLRHLGPVRFRAVPAAARPAAADRHVRQRPDPVVAVRRPALRHRHADRRPDPRDHGAALHHLDHPATCSRPCRRC